jgi:hypothetical protein
MKKMENRMPKDGHTHTGATLWIWKKQKYFTKPVLIEYVSEKSNTRDAHDRKGDNILPKVRKNAKCSNNRYVRTKGSRKM